MKITDEQIRQHIKNARLEHHLTQKQLSDMIGRSESTVQGYESGKTDIPLSAFLKMADALQMDLDDLLTGYKPTAKPANLTEIRVYSLEERLQVAGILIKNGYKVSQNKTKKPNSKAIDYYLTIEEVPDFLDSSR